MAEVNVQEKRAVLVTKGKAFVVPLLRILAFIGTAGATIVMALNKETSTFVVGTIGSNPIRLTLTAKFQHTPAFVYFVIANCIASFHNLVMLAVEFVAQKYNFKGFLFEIVPILDIIMVALVSGGATAAAFMGELGREGNSHAQWNKICDKFDTFCDRGSAAMLASFIGLFLLIIITIVSFFKYQIQRSVNHATIL